MVLVSVIMPVYNAAPYLKKAMDSIIEQTYRNIELICVDDGSKDNSIEILRSYESRYGTVRIISQDNRGAGIARNVGLKEAKGKYVIFLDSDDYFDFCLIEKLVSCAEKNIADISICKAIAIDRKDNKTDLNFNNRLFRKYNAKAFSPFEVKEEVLTSFLVEPWNKLYRRDFLIKNDIEFQNLKKTNDLFFTSVSLIKAKIITLVDEKLIFYRLDNRAKYITEYEDRLLDHYRALLKTKEAISSIDLCNEFLVSFYRMALKIILYNLSLNFSDNVRKILISLYTHEGLRNLGFFNRKVVSALSYIERLQIKLVYDNYPFKIQYYLYKYSKVLEYLNKNGFKATLVKILN